MAQWSQRIEQVPALWNLCIMSGEWSTLTDSHSPLLLLPCRTEKRRNVESEKTKPPLTLRQNDCLFRRCHLSNTACFAVHKGGEGRGERREGKVKYDWKFWGQLEEVAPV